MRSSIVLVFLLSTLLLCSYASRQAKITLSALNEKSIEAKIENIGSEEFDFTLESSIFSHPVLLDQLCVYKDQARVSYIGAIAKYANLVDLKNLKVGESFTNQLDLSLLYDFKEAGDHSIVFCGDVGSDIELVVEPLIFSVSSQMISLKDVQLNELMESFKREKTQATIVGCTTAVTTASQTAATNAIDGNNQAKGWPAGTEKDDKFTEWFGPKDTSGQALITAHFTAISNEFNANSYSINCGSSTCSANVFAFVYPTDTTHKIYVCGAYENAAETWEQDSKPGTLTHEMSHFNDVAGTGDYAYGPTNCRNLATSNPAQAKMNADSHEYYIELTLGDSTLNCFIATAAYGSSMEKKVDVIRKFRDDYLMKSEFGRSFVKNYYQFSPPIAAYLARSSILRFGVRTILYPVVFILDRFVV